MKRCSRCGIEKERSEFTTQRASRDGLASWCKLCKRKLKQETYWRRKRDGPDISITIDGSWAGHDHVRHFMYEHLFAALRGLEWTLGAYRVLEIGTREPTSSVMRMLFNLLGDACHSTLGDYPDVDIQKMFYPDESFDVVIADQVLEHVERPWLAAEEIRRVLDGGGLAIVATPFVYPIHKAPLDCWRIAPDGYKVLFPVAQWEWIEFGMWGDHGIVQWEYNSPRTRGLTGEWMSVAEARAALGEAYRDHTDELHPIVIWWMGRKK